MENNNINISEFEEAIMKTVKEKIEKLIETEIDAYLAENTGVRNGYYQRKLKTRYGEIEDLNIPRDRESNFSTALFNKYDRSIGMEDLVISMYANGISTRRISEILEDVMRDKYSPSAVSRITDVTLEEINSFRSKKLDKRYIAVLLDGLFFFLRRGDVDKEPVIFALGIKETGEYEILGFYLTVKESHNNYNDVLQDLYSRGLKEPLLFIADGISNLDEEIVKIYPRAEFQLCTIHYLRGIKSKVKERDSEDIVNDANKMFTCNNKNEARDKFNDFKNKWNNRYPDIVYNTEKKTGRLFRFYDYPENIRRSLKSTNAIERFNEEIRRRVKTISSFPDTKSAEKVFYYKSIEYNSKHAFKVMNGYYKSRDEIREMFQKRYPL